MFKKILLGMGLASMILFTGMRGTETAMAAEEYVYDVVGSVEVTASEMKADGTYDITVTWDLGEDYRGFQVWADAFDIYGDTSRFSKAFISADEGTKTFNFDGAAGKYIYNLGTSEGSIVGSVTIGNGADAEYQAEIDKRIDEKIAKMESFGRDYDFEYAWMKNSNNAGVSIPAYGTVIENYEDIAVPQELPVYEDEIDEPTDEEMQKAVEETPEPTEAPEPTVVPTEAPEPTAVPTEVPEPTVVPEVTETPEPVVEPTEIPEITEAPVETPVVTEAPVEVPEVTEAPVEQPEITEAPVVEKPSVDNTENFPSSDDANEVSTGTSDIEEEKVDFTVPVIFGVCFIGFVIIVVVIVFSSKKRG